MCLRVNGDKFVCSPRIAAQAIVRLVNSTKVNQAMLALTVSFFFSCLYTSILYSYLVLVAR